MHQIVMSDGLVVFTHNVVSHNDQCVSGARNSPVGSLTCSFQAVLVSMHKRLMGKTTRRILRAITHQSNHISHLALKACLHQRFNCDRIATGSSWILSALVRVLVWVDLCGSDRDPGNPPLTGGLDVDQVMWRFDSLEERGYTKCWVILGMWKRRTHCSSRTENVFTLTAIRTFTTFSLSLAASIFFLLVLWSNIATKT